MEESERLNRYVTRVFERSGRTEFATVKQAARALRWTQGHVIEVAESNDFMVNVAIGCNGAYGELDQRDWEIEPLES